MRPVQPRGFRSDWPSVPLWSVFRRTSRRGAAGEALLSVYRDHGVVERDAIEGNWNRVPEDLSSYQLVLGGDLVLNKMKAWQGSLGISPLRGVVSPAYYVFSPTGHGADARFLHYQLRSRPFVEAYGRMSDGIRTDQWDLDSWAFSRTKVFLPALDEQVAIADFLDRETAKIDALIDKQGQLVASLFLRRVNLIEAAVGAVAGRTTTQLKHALERIDQGISPDTSSADDSADWAVLKAGCSNHGVFREDESKPLPTAVAIPPGIGVRPGDLITSRANGSPRLVGSTALVGNLTKKLILSDKTFRLVPRRGVSAEYLFWVMNSEGYRSQVIAGISGAEGLANNLPLSTLRRIRIWLPDLSAQNLIASGLERKTARIDALTDRAERMITLARERRAALITAAVTGQIDVSTGMVA